MDFLQFIHQQAKRSDPIGSAARAVRHEFIEGQASSRELEEELRREAKCLATYHAIKDLWKLWLEHKKQPA